MRRSACLLACALTLVGCDDAGDDPPCIPQMDLLDQRLRVDGRVLRDAAGRSVLLRGINTGGRSKDPPFMPFEFAEADQPAPPFEEALAGYADRLVEWGINVARVPFSWEALEPEPGRIDTAWLDRYVALVRALGERDIRVLVEFHQDVFNRAFCGDGFPDWTLPPGPLPTPPGCRYWFSGYQSQPGVQAAFDRFWADEDGIQTAFDAMWRRMALTLWQEPNVIGFEIMNEPASGTADPDAWAVEVLAPFYARMAASIRSVAPGALVFVGPSGGDALSAQTSLPRPDVPDLVFAPHFFVPSVVLQGHWDGGGDIAAALARWSAVGGGWNAPVFLGAFGVPPEGLAVDYLEQHYAALDVLGMHATVWEYSLSEHVWNDEAMNLVTPDGRAYPTLDAVVRPYPAAVAGEVTLFAYDAQTRVAELRYRAERDGISELRLPQRVWPDGPRVRLDPEQGCFELSGDRLRIKARWGGEVVVRVEE